jgi:hypothetical protein
MMPWDLAGAPHSRHSVFWRNWALVAQLREEEVDNERRAALLR